MVDKIKVLAKLTFGAQGPASSLPVVRPKLPERRCLPIEPSATFDKVWQMIETRCLNEYPQLRNSYQIKTLQDCNHANIDLRDTVYDILACEQDKTVIVVLTPIEREISLPTGTSLRPAAGQKRGLTAEQAQSAKRKKLEHARYGSTVDEMNPDEPIRSLERDMDSVERGTPYTVTNDCFKIPKLPRHTTVRQPDSVTDDHSITNNFTQQPLGLDDDASIRDDLSIQDSEQPDIGRAYASPVNETPDYVPELDIDNSVVDNEGSIKSAEAEASWSVMEENVLRAELEKERSLGDIQRDSFPSRTPQSIKQKAKAIGRSPALTDQSRQSARKTSTPAHWSQADLNALVKVVRENREAPYAKNRYFHDKSLQEVMERMSEKRRQIQAEKDQEADRVAAEQRLSEQSEAGINSSHSGEKFTQEEDNLLLAVLLSGTEMKRVQMHYLPGREIDDVKRRASRLFHRAERNHEATQSTHLPSSTDASVSSQAILNSLSSPLRHQVIAKQNELRHLVPMFDQQSAKKRQEKDSREQEKTDRIKRVHDRRIRTDNSVANGREVEERNAMEDDLQQRRCDEDRKNLRQHREEFAIWEAQKEIDLEAGQPIQPEPRPARGSSIGIELAITQEENVQSRKASTPAPSTSTKQIARASRSRTPGTNQELSEHRSAGGDPDSNLKERPVQTQKSHKPGPNDASNSPVSARKTRTPAPASSLSHHSRRSVSFHNEVAEDRISRSKSSPVEARKIAPQSILKKRQTVHEEVAASPAQMQIQSPKQTASSSVIPPPPNEPARALLSSSNTLASPLNMDQASRASDRTRNKVAQSPITSVNKASTALQNATTAPSRHSPPFINSPTATHVPVTYSLKQNRQTKLHFQRDKGKGSAEPSLSQRPLKAKSSAFKALKGMLSTETIDLSSDSSSEDMYNDSDLDDHTLSVAAEQSSQQLRSEDQTHELESYSATPAKSLGGLASPETPIRAASTPSIYLSPLPYANTATANALATSSPPARTMTAIVDIQREAENQLLREMKGPTVPFLQHDDDDDQSMCDDDSSLGDPGPSKEVAAARAHLHELEEQARAEQRVRSDAYLVEAKKEEDQKKRNRKAAYRREVSSRYEQETVASRALNNGVHDGNDEPADEEVVNVYRSDLESESGSPCPYQAPDHEDRDATPRAQAQLDVPDSYEPTSSPPDLPNGLQLPQTNNLDVSTQDTFASIKTADLAPPFPSSGKVREPTPSPRKEITSFGTGSENTQVTPGAKPHQPSSATSLSVDGGVTRNGITGKSGSTARAESVARTTPTINNNSTNNTNNTGNTGNRKKKGSNMFTRAVQEHKEKEAQAKQATTASQQKSPSVAGCTASRAGTMPPPATAPAATRTKTPTRDTSMKPPATTGKRTKAAGRLQSLGLRDQQEADRLNPIGYWPTWADRDIHPDKLPKPKSTAPPARPTHTAVGKEINYKTLPKFAGGERSDDDESVGNSSD